MLTFNDLEPRNGSYFCVISLNSVALSLRANYVEVVEVRSKLFAKEKFNQKNLV